MALGLFARLLLHYATVNISLQWFKDNIGFIYFSLYCPFQLAERSPCSELNLQASQAPSQLRAGGLVHQLVKSP